MTCPVPLQRSNETTMSEHPKQYTITANEFARARTDRHPDGSGGYKLDLGLPLGPKALLIIYATYGEGYGETVAELARALPASTKSVTRWTKELEQGGWVTVKHRFNKGSLVTLTEKAQKYFGRPVADAWGDSKSPPAEEPRTLSPGGGDTESFCGGTQSPSKKTSSKKNKEEDYNNREQTDVVVARYTELLKQQGITAGTALRLAKQNTTADIEHVLDQENDSIHNWPGFVVAALDREYDFQGYAHCDRNDRILEDLENDIAEGRVALADIRAYAQRYYKRLDEDDLDNIEYLLGLRRDDQALGGD